MIKVSDYIANRISEAGITDVFMITGGGAMHLNNSFGKHPNLKYTCFHHEQAAAMASESYARLTGKIAALNVTTGPGGINAMNGVFGAWTDSIPMLVISGQVRYDTTVYSAPLNLRQLGDQEYTIIESVAPMTKYAVVVKNPLEIRYHLEKALFLANAGRPGPVWLDIPMNVQGVMIDESKLMIYNNREDNYQIPPGVSNKTIELLIGKIKEAKRPVILAGGGVRISNSYRNFLKLIDILGIPVVTGWNANDLLENEHPLYCGRPGTIGDRGGNFTVQNSDLLIVLGSRLNIRQIGYNWKTFARDAFIVMVDADSQELFKPTLNINLPIHADLNEFISKFLLILNDKPLEIKADWLKWCKFRLKKYPVVLPEYLESSTLVNPYCFFDKLTKEIPEDSILVAGNGTAAVCLMQAANVKKGQRIYSNSGSASMGYDLPASIGACIGSGNKKVLCFAGDGSLQMNIQELQTVVKYNLPVKIFYLNNDGYHSIKQTQENFFGKPFVGCNDESGVSFPDMRKIAYAYGIDYIKCNNHSEMNSCIQKTMDDDKPFICEVIFDPIIPFAPKSSSVRLEDGRIVSRPLEDLAPFLSRNELKENMIIRMIDE